ncbi:hypothetical protein TI39_contig5864g00004 [Zymoseptoria brevis]|uniref:Alpha/beta hydrolase fold-3 domain-containing protein n=1 Tax=Zymoseptoria brevis TaxID=1047168 RepID=A0A0F4G5M7_9PEZI|nr:hypothetical protein TI39_contig5864g00004 [Zymoseptoria brevis]
MSAFQYTIRVHTDHHRVQTFVIGKGLYPSRIFLPQGYSAAEHELFSPVVCVHGGGLLVNNSPLDDPLARHLADASRSMVVSIDYRKAPQNKFPSAYEDVVEQILAVIDDSTLPLDHKNIVLCGRFVGGNLVLAAAQNPQIRDRLTGVIAVYPICDLVPSFGEDMASRPGLSVPDFLGSTYPGISDLCLGQNANVELTDVRLSLTHFKSRGHLPQNVLMVACEHDLLRREAEVMAERIATLEGSSKAATNHSWRAGCIEWYSPLPQPAFEVSPAKTPEKEAARKAVFVGGSSDGICSSDGIWRWQSTQCLLVIGFRVF